jgi:hypothetical protein
VPTAGFAMPGLRVGQCSAWPKPVQRRRAIERFLRSSRRFGSCGRAESVKAQIQLDPQQFGDLTVVLKVEGRKS